MRGGAAHPSSPDLGSGRWRLSKLQPPGRPEGEHLPEAPQMLALGVHPKTSGYLS